MRAAFMTLMLATPAMAQVPADISPSGCHLRVYTAQHLAANPVQRVQAIALRVADVDTSSGALIFDLAVRVKGRAEVYRGAAYCDPLRDGTYDCRMEGDAGSFTLGGGRDGALRLAVGRYGVSFEGARDFLTLEGTSGDDRVFLLPAAPEGDCR